MDQTNLSVGGGSMMSVRNEGFRSHGAGGTCVIALGWAWQAPFPVDRFRPPVVAKRPWGKRSPHEATCPRIASGFHRGRIMSAVIQILSRKLSDLTVPLAAGVSSARLLAEPCVRRLP
jgi:hypothetical protein